MSSPAKPPPAGSRWRRLKRIAAVCMAIGLGIVVYANFAPGWVSRGRLYDKPEDVPANLVALVFGTTDRVDGRDNLYFRYRIDAAEQLWKSGRIRAIVVSGDNSTRYYNEPEKMRQALIARGIPGDRIHCDYAGLRTLDSVVRAREVCGLTSVVFISQRFQNERAIYIARAHGLDARGFNARDVTTRSGFKTRLREVGARALMWLDVHVLGTRPKFPGGHIDIPR